MRSNRSLTPEDTAPISLTFGELDVIFEALYMAEKNEH